MKSLTTWEPEPNTGCWLWTGGLDGHGYAHQGPIAAYILFYVDAKGPIPTGMEIDHTCGNIICVNPDHLEAVTHAENVRRGKSVKLYHQLADAIRFKAISGVPVLKLAFEYGVTTSHIYRILSGKHWT